MDHQFEIICMFFRFHRSAGLTSEGRSNSPVSMFDSPVSSSYPYANPRFAPYPHPTVVNPLAQLRQPVYMQNVGASIPRHGKRSLTTLNFVFVCIKYCY